MRMPNAQRQTPYAARMPGETPIGVFALGSRTDRTYRGEP